MALCQVLDSKSRFEQTKELKELVDKLSHLLPWTLFTATTVQPGLPGKLNASPRDTTPNAPCPITFSTFRFEGAISHSLSPENGKFISE